MSSLTIGKLAKACEVKIDTIRYYERIGLIIPINRTDAGYRVYADDSIKRLKFIRKAQSLGFTLEEIKEILALSELSNVDCGDIKERAVKKIAEIQLRIRDLESIQNALKQLAKFCPGEGQDLSQCNILQHFYGEDE